MAKRLGLSHKEFLNSSPRILETMDYYNTEYNKSILLSAYIDVVKPRIENESNEEKVICNSFDDLF